jgi:hypothetical protein
MNLKIKEAQVLYDAKGRKTHVLLPYKRYEKLIEHIEDLEDIKAAKEVEHEEDIPWEEVKKKLDKKNS